MSQLNELEKIIGMIPMDEEKKKNVLKHSAVFFEYREYMKEKYKMSDEAVEAKTNEYVQAKLAENPEKLKLVMSGDISPISEFSQEQATEEGFVKPIEESMTVFMDFYKNLSSGGF